MNFCRQISFWKNVQPGVRTLGNRLCDPGREKQFLKLEARLPNKPGNTTFILMCLCGSFAPEFLIFAQLLKFHAKLTK